MATRPSTLRRLLALLLRRRGSHGSVSGIKPDQPLEVAMDEMERRNAAENMTCRDPRDDAAEREHREKVRAVSERVRAENREILNRLATK